MGYRDTGSKSLEPMRCSKQAEWGSGEAGGKSTLPISSIVAVMAEDAYLVVQSPLEKATMRHETRIAAWSNGLADAGTIDIIEIRHPG